MVEGLVEMKRGDGQVSEGEREVVHGSLLSTHMSERGGWSTG